MTIKKYIAITKMKSKYPELVKELRSKKSRDNRELLDKAANAIEELLEQLPDTQERGHIELWDDADIETCVEKLYHECVEKDCDVCSARNELGENTCKSDVIMELWRKWKNAKAGVIK